MQLPNVSIWDWDYCLSYFHLIANGGKSRFTVFAWANLRTNCKCKMRHETYIYAKNFNAHHHMRYAILLISPSESLAVRCDTIWKTFCVFNRTWNLLLLWKLLTRPEFSIVEFRLAFFFFSAYKQSAIKSHESLRQFIHEKWKWTLLA